EPVGGQDLGKGRSFVVAALRNDTQAEFTGPARRCLRWSATQQAHLHPLLASPDDAESVADEEGLRFAAGGMDVQRPVGQHAVDVEKNQLYASGPIADLLEG